MQLRLDNIETTTEDTQSTITSQRPETAFRRSAIYLSSILPLISRARLTRFLQRLAKDQPAWFRTSVLLTYSCSVVLGMNRPRKKE